MTDYGMRLTNAIGQDIIYGDEFIPVCVYAFQVTAVRGTSLQYRDTGLPFDTNYTIFTRGENCLVIPFDNNGKLRIYYGYSSNVEFSMVPEFVAVNIYIMGPVPVDIATAGHGMVVRNARGHVIFYSDYPPFHLETLVTDELMMTGEPRFIGRDKAVMPQRFYVWGGGLVGNRNDIFSYTYMVTGNGYLGMSCSSRYGPVFGSISGTPATFTTIYIADTREADSYYGLSQVPGSYRLFKPGETGLYSGYVWGPLMFDVLWYTAMTAGGFILTETRAF